MKSDDLNFTKLEFAISSSEDGIWEYDIQSGSTYVSNRWLEIIGYDETEYQSSIEAWSALLHPDDKEATLAVLYDSIANKIESAHVRYRIRHKNGQWLWIHDRAKILYSPLGEPLTVAGFRTDITKQLELETNNQELATIVQRTSVEIYILDVETLRYLYANDGALKALGYSLDELKELTLTDINPDISSEQIDTFREYLNKISPVLSNLSRHKRKNGTFYPVKASVHKLSYHGRSAVVIFDTDITELTSTQEQLLKLATHDTLTGLPNRMLFYDRLQMSIKQIHRQNRKTAVMFLDLDHFKQINDSLGHPVGDKLLVAVAERLRTTLRDSDTIARMGGDEFNILIDGIKHTKSLAQIAQKILRAFHEPFHIDNRELFTSLSIGIAISPDDGSTSEVLLKNADAAMYKAKGDGRNTFRFYAKELGEKAYERVVLENALRIAIKQHQLEVFYQPQIELLSKSIVGLEALVRWKHPTLGIITPDLFIPVSEDIGLVYDIDLFVLKQVIKDQKIWHHQNLSIPKTAINLSAKTLAHETLATEIDQILHMFSFDSINIAFEVTESHIMKNPEQVIHQLYQLRQLGIETSVDDFGTGYSSLSYLKKLPINKLKIDQSFIRDIPTDEDDMAITKTIITLAYNLKLDVIAEGVETHEQEIFLIQNGCTYAQGYRYGRPVPLEKITDMLKLSTHDTDK